VIGGAGGDLQPVAINGGPCSRARTSASEAAVALAPECRRYRRCTPRLVRLAPKFRQCPARPPLKGCVFPPGDDPPSRIRALTLKVREAPGINRSRELACPLGPDQCLTTWNRCPGDGTQIGAGTCLRSSRFNLPRMIRTSPMTAASVAR